jgi:hypothetical protein
MHFPGFPHTYREKFSTKNYVDFIAFLVIISIPMNKFWDAEIITCTALKTTLATCFLVVKLFPPLYTSLFFLPSQHSLRTTPIPYTAGKTSLHRIQSLILEIQTIQNKLPKKKQS